MHTVKDIEKDIFQVEGIKIDISDFTESDKFMTKYSEHYDKQIRADSSDNDLIDRVSEYVYIDQGVKDRLLETIIKDLTKEKRRDQIARIMSNHVITSILTTVMIVTIYFIIR